MPKYLNHQKYIFLSCVKLAGRFVPLLFWISNNLFFKNSTELTAKSGRDATVGETSNNFNLPDFLYLADLRGLLVPKPRYRQFISGLLLIPFLISILVDICGASDSPAVLNGKNRIFPTLPDRLNK